MPHLSAIAPPRFLNSNVGRSVSGHVAERSNLRMLMGSHISRIGGFAPVVMNIVVRKADERLTVARDWGTSDPTVGFWIDKHLPVITDDERLVPSVTCKSGIAIFVFDAAVALDQNDPRIVVALRVHNVGPRPAHEIACVRIGQGDIENRGRLCHLGNGDIALIGESNRHPAKRKALVRARTARAFARADAK